MRDQTTPGANKRLPPATSLELPKGDFLAYLFDCDGTIADSMPLHYLAWSQALGEQGCEFPEELFYRWGGLPIIEIVARLSSIYGIEMPIEEVAMRKEALFCENLSQLKAVPEVLEHIEAQHGRIPFAVVSGGTREAVESSLRVLGLLDRFELLVCAGDYRKSKPDPEPFLIAAQKLNIPPGNCLVFEDTELGLDAARAAGMASVKVPSRSDGL